MSPHEVWFLLALALIIGGFGGSLIGNWWAQRQCCGCCTCENCGEEMFYANQDHDYPLSRLATTGEDHRAPVQVDAWGPDPDTRRRPVLVLEPGPTIYPELAALAEQAIDGPQIDAERPDTGTWLRTQRIWMERSYPIPGTPQWEARHPIHQEA